MSQRTKLKSALKYGRRLTPYSALKIAGTLRLSERIRELESEGLRIARRFVKVGRARVMEYRKA